MSISLHWDERVPQLLQVDMSQRYTWDEFYGLLDDLKAANQDVEGRFDIIFVSGSLPAGNTLPHFQNMQRLMSSLEHLGVSVTVINPKDIFARTILNVINQLKVSTKRSILVNSLDEAYQQIHSNRER
jgi:hypothetical protein